MSRLGRIPFLLLLRWLTLSSWWSLNDARVTRSTLISMSRRPRRRPGEPLISRREKAQNGLVCSAYEDNNTVCIINKSMEISAPTFSFAGDVKFVGNITVASSSALQLNAHKVSLDKQAKLAIHGDIIINASKIIADVGSTFVSKGVVQLTAGEDAAKAQERRLSGVSDDDLGFDLHGLIDGSRIILRHPTGAINLQEGKYTANDKLGKTSLIIIGLTIRVTTAASIQANQVSIEAEHDANFAANRITGAPSQDKAADTPLEAFKAYAGGHLNIGCSLTTHSFIAVAKGSITIAAAGTLRTTGHIASNLQSKRTTRCVEVLESFPSRTSEPGGAAVMVKSKAGDNELTFDFVVASKDGVTIDRNSRLSSASMFVCAAKTIEMSEDVLVDADSRGCGPDRGSGKGLWNASGSCAGGGSNFGIGGKGAQYDSVGAEACAEPGEQQPLHLYSEKLLPTQSASGGACSGVSLFGSPSCPAQEPYNSYGGGLIWIATKTLLKFNKQVVIRADGQKGKMIGGDEQHTAFASGGGSGGQILIWAGDLALTGEATLSVKGGDAQCSTQMAGGAGGGGFVGMGLKNNTHVDDETNRLSRKISGGTVSEDCVKQKISEEAKNIVSGKKGIEASLFPCPPGHSGLFCDACPVGTWNNDGGLVCNLCDNKPKKSAEYTEIGVTQRICPYHCVNGVPSVVGNPECLNIPEFVLHFFGGPKGLLVILLGLVILVTLLLWRRARSNKRLAADMQAGISFHQGRFDGMLGKSSPLLDDRRMLRFSKEQLPYHVCRIFLTGSNTSPRPWGLDGEIPQILESMLQQEHWSRFVNEISDCTYVPRNQRWCEKSLELCYPPAAPVYALKCRRKRSIALQQCVHAFSEGTGEREAVWKPLRVRFDNPVNAGTSVLGMAFGCDSGATLGYIDFFDFARSQLDFAPIDLRQEVRIMTAHGDGSYLEPFALDPADPLLQHLGQMGCGISAVYSVVAAFNWNARRVKNADLRSGSSPALEDLKKGVEDCAARSGLSGLVQVIVSRQQRSVVRRSRAAPRFAAMETSFSELCGGSSDMRHSPHSLSPIGSAFDLSSQPSTKNVDSKLCLAFADCNEPWDIHTPRSPPLNGNGFATTWLTSPMPRPLFGQYLAGMKSTSLEEVRKLPFWRRCSQQAASWALNARVSAQSDNGLASPATVVLVILIALLFVDLMLFILMGYLVSQFSVAIFLAWLLIPPLAGPMAITLGPVIVLTENARLARMYVVTLLFSLSSTLLILVMLIIANHDSWIFHIVECFTAITVKAVLVICANAHIASLESAQDLSFAGSQQVDAASGMILSGDPASAFEKTGIGTLEQIKLEQRRANAGGRKFPSAPSDSGFEWDETRLVSDDSVTPSQRSLKVPKERQRNYTTLSDMARQNSRTARSADSDTSSKASKASSSMTTNRSISATPF